MFINITLRTGLLAFGVAGAVFRIAGEMRRLPAYFDNAGRVHRHVYNRAVQNQKVKISSFSKNDQDAKNVSITAVS